MINTYKNMINMNLNKSIQEMKESADSAVNTFQQKIENVISDGEGDDITPFYMIDLANCELSNSINTITVLKHISPDEKIRELSREIEGMVNERVTDIVKNRELYMVLCKTAQNLSSETLSKNEKKFIDDTLTEMKIAGLDLPDEKLKILKNLERQLSQKCIVFSKNISNNVIKLYFELEELDGLPEDILKRTECINDNYEYNV